VDARLPTPSSRLGGEVEHTASASRRPAQADVEVELEEEHMARDRRITIHFTDGNQLAFKFPQQAELSVMATAVQKALERDKITIEAEGALYTVPLTNVKYIRMSPVPQRLPDAVITGATLAD
jgi:hypothetical protein